MTADEWLAWLESAGRYWDTHRLEDERMGHTIVASGSALKVRTEEAREPSVALELDMPGERLLVRFQDRAEAVALAMDLLQRAELVWPEDDEP